MQSSVLSVTAAFTAGVVVGALGYKYAAVEKKLNAEKLAAGLESLNSRLKSVSGRGPDRGRAAGAKNSGSTNPLRTGLSLVSSLSGLAKLAGAVGAAGAAGTMLRKGRR